MCSALRCAVLRYVMLRCVCMPCCDGGRRAGNGTVATALLSTALPGGGEGGRGGEPGGQGPGGWRAGAGKNGVFFSFSSFFFLLSKKAKRDDGLQCIDYEDYLTYEQCTGPGQSRPNPTIPSVGWSPTGRFGRLGQRPFLTPNYLFDAYRVQYSPSFLRRRGRWGFKSS